MARLSLSVLGPFQATLDGEPITSLKSDKARALLAYLAMHPDMPSRRDVLASLLWPERTDANARRNLRAALNRLRDALGDRAADPPYLRTSRQTIQLNPGCKHWVDVHAFRDAVAATAVHPHADLGSCSICAARLKQAVALYRGDFMAGFSLDSVPFEEWMVGVREALHGQALHALGALASYHVAHGNYEQAIRCARRQVALEPWHEPAHRQWMRALALSGHRAAALAQYEACRQVLDEELGIEPEPATKRLYQRIHDGELRPPPSPAPQAATHPLPVYRPVAPVAHADRGRGLSALSSPLVGRQDEVQALQRAVALARAGMGGIVTVVGEPGIGKSRLVAEVRTARGQARGSSSETLARVRTAPTGPPLQWVEGHGLLYGSSAAYHLWLDLLRALLGVEAGTPPSLLRETLRQQVQQLCPDAFDAVYPHLGTLLSLPLEAQAQDARRGVDAEGRRTLTFRAIARLLEASAAQQPLVVVCEDLHWADPTSLALLEEAFVLTDRVPLTFVCTLRPETAQPCWRIHEVAAREYHHRHTDLWLQPLAQDDGQALLDNLLRSAPAGALPEELKAPLVGHGQGNPFYIQEILRSLAESGAISCDEQSCTWEAHADFITGALPGTLYDVLMGRIDHLPQPARHVLQLAAVIGPSFSYPLLAAISGGARLEEHLLALQGAGMIRAQASQPGRTYAFLHQLTQEAAYGSLQRRARRVLHRRVAEALEQRHAGDIDDQLGLLAHHWEQAGDVEHAVAYLHRAGERAAAQYAIPEAVSYYTRALNLLPQEGLERRYALLLARERAHDLQGAREEQGQDLFALADLAEALDDDRRRTEVALRQAHHAQRAEQQDAAIRFAQAAIRLAHEARDLGMEAVARLELGKARRMSGFSAGMEQFEKALRLAQEACLPAVQADAWRELGLTAYGLGDLAAARAHHAQALRVERESGDRMHESKTLNALATVAIVEGDLGAAEAYVQQGLSLCRATGNRHDEADALSAFAWIREAEGEYATAQAGYEDALALFRAVDDRPGQATTIARQARILHQLGDDLSALVRSRDALRLAGAGSEREGQGEALISLGYAFFALAQTDRAADAYRRAIALYEQGGVPHRTIEPRAGLAEVYLAQRDLSRARSGIECVLAGLGPGLTSRDPATSGRVHLTCYRVLRAAADPRADGILQKAYDLLQERAAKIAEPALRRSFVENVPAHRELIAAFEQR